MFLSNFKKYEDEYILDGLAILAMLFFVSLALSYSFPITAIAIFCFASGYVFFKFNKLAAILAYLKSLKVLVKVLLTLYAVTLLSVLFHSLQFYQIDPLVRSSLFRAVAFNIYAVIFFIEIRKANLDAFLYKFSRYTAISIALISLFSLVRLAFCFGGVILETDVVVSEWQLFLSSLVADNNYYALGILAGIFSVIYLWRKGFAFSKFWFAIMWIALYYAASRRAVLIGFALMIYFMIVSCLDAKKGFNFLKLGKQLIFFCLGIATYLFVPGILQKNFSPASKANFFESFGFDYAHISNYMPLARFRYLTLLDENNSLRNLTLEFHHGKDSFFYISPKFFSFKMMFSGESLKPVKKKAQLKLDDFSYEFIGSLAPTNGGRVERWAYALEEFKSYSLPQKLFGAGGKYHFSFGERFKSPTGEVGFDYPHNPLLSLLLYSGVFVMLAFFVVYLCGVALFAYPNVLTLGLFPTAHFFNSVSLDLLWANYHFPFMVIFAVKLVEIVGVKRAEKN